MKKHKTILQLLEKLNTFIIDNRITIVDHREGDLCAIGFRKGTKLMYISTSNYADHKPIKYDCDLEELSESNPESYHVVKEVRGVSEEILVKELRFCF